MSNKQGLRSTGDNANRIISIYQPNVGIKSGDGLPSVAQQWRSIPRAARLGMTTVTMWMTVTIKSVGDETPVDANIGSEIPVCPWPHDLPYEYFRKDSRNSEQEPNSRNLKHGFVLDDLLMCASLSRFGNSRFMS